MAELGDLLRPHGPPHLPHEQWIERPGLDPHVIVTRYQQRHTMRAPITRVHHHHLERSDRIEAHTDRVRPRLRRIKRRDFGRRL